MTQKQALKQLEDYSKMVRLKSPNPLVFMRVSYTRLQLRTVVILIEKLQDLLRKSYAYYEKHNALMPLEETGLLEEDKIRIKVGYREMGLDTYHYEKLRESLLEMATIPIELRYEKPDGYEYIVFQSLCKVKIDSRYSRIFTIEVERDVVRLLLNIKQGFTKFLKDVAMKFEGKYTLRMYLLISAFKNKGHFEVTVWELRKMLGLTNKLQRYDNFYDKVIRLTQNELYQKNADCWFEVEAIDGFKPNGEPYKLRFKIIKAQDVMSIGEVEIVRVNRNRIMDLCRGYFGMTEAHFDGIRDLITIENGERIYEKILELINYCRKNRSNIQNITDYAYMALKNELQNERNIK